MSYQFARFAGRISVARDRRAVLPGWLWAWLFVVAAPLLAEALTNEDVVKLARAGMGDGVILAKVREAESVDFQTDVDSLVGLREAGVSEAVIEAILERSAGGFRSSAPATSSPAAAPPAMFEPGAATHLPGMQTIDVALDAGQGPVPIQVLRGEFSRSGFGAFGASFMNYPGLQARVRTRQTTPKLLIRSAEPLSGNRYFLVKVEIDKDDGVRSLKVSSMGQTFKSMFKSGKLTEPDPDWRVPFSAKEVGANLWEVVPDQPLEAGEYGWYVDLGQGMQQAGMFPFGVDP